MPITDANATGSPKSQRAAQLGNEIRAATAAHPVEISLSTSQRIIARVTDGIYREPWAAFRELCANAYDADANEVVIETGAPAFDQITIRDDGYGMSPETLAWVVENIGGSSKRTEDGVTLHTANAADPELSPGKRPLIGKIGIGLFAVAQLTQHFQIITKARGEAVRSWATVRLRTHNEASLKSSKQEIWQAGKAKIVSERVPEDELESHGTTIVLHDLRPEIRNLLQSQSRWASATQTDADGEKLTPPPKYHIGGRGADGRPIGSFPPWTGEPGSTGRFDALVAAASETSASDRSASSLDHLDEYYKSVWKLALSLPLPYLEEHPFETAGEDGLISFELQPRTKAVTPLDLAPQETLRGRLGLVSGRPDPAGGFSVVFDGIRLRRPIKLPKQLTRSSRIKAPVIVAAKVKAPFDEKSLERAGGGLAFEAYLYWNSTVTPKDVQGVLIRVRDASGTLFDRKFMDYQVSEQTRLSQVTAEIFVTEGLDGALNIDRESFNYSHPHYIYIKKWLHAALKLLFNRLKGLAKEDLDREKAHSVVAKANATVETALEVWRSRMGEDADPPSAVSPPPPTPAPAPAPFISSNPVPHWTDKLAPGGYISNQSNTLPRALESICWKDGDSLGQLKRQGPYHVVNIDACGSIAPVNSSQATRLIEAIHKIVEYQISSSRTRWLFFLTVDVRRDNLDERTFESLCDAIRQNAAASADFAEAARDLFDPSRQATFEDALQAAKHQSERSTLDVFMLGAAKWLLHLVEPKLWSVRMKHSYCYSTTGAEDGPATMCSLAFEFHPPAPGLPDPLGASRGQPAPGGPVGDASMQIVEAASKVEDLDRLMEANDALVSELNRATRDLLEEAGYHPEALQTFEDGQRTQKQRCFPDVP